MSNSNHKQDFENHIAPGRRTTALKGTPHIGIEAFPDGSVPIPGKGHNIVWSL